MNSEFKRRPFEEIFFYRTLALTPSCRKGDPWITENLLSKISLETRFGQVGLSRIGRGDGGTSLTLDPTPWLSPGYLAFPDLDFRHASDQVSAKRSVPVHKLISTEKPKFSNLNPVTIALFFWYAADGCLAWNFR